MVQLSRKVSFGDLSRGNKVWYVLCIFFGIIFVIDGILDAFGYLQLIQIRTVANDILELPRWLASIIAFAAALSCLYVMPSIIKDGSADRIQEKILELVKKGKVIIFPRRNTKH
ncbi:hypothetical protein A2Z63_03010 [Candidatus Giovannonibacteria bacterium RIFCSPLOWO2_02_44_8]|uniref:Uncharacterized protein n=2 Tax=Candidatus Giovannoniibacteriota TaxID=1752738 RepID=A0A1F5XAI5_9BACT|nr:MAG: hypothetical protein A2W57_02470 [Candidatus Giovannonibacteria bacterium RIFCSPHIGHO2_02_43_16]OGF84870.1 MAG: hypothetical protein A2Z63_03010 [Candidatus Giovannonibacteria bacterium RIFCSPLOWO2_02_44_8]